jgi:hypothetical protein
MSVTLDPHITTTITTVLKGVEIQETVMDLVLNIRAFVCYNHCQYHHHQYQNCNQLILRMCSVFPVAPLLSVCWLPALSVY